MPDDFVKDLRAAVAAVVNPRFEAIDRVLAGLQKSERSIMSTEAQLQSTLDSIQAQESAIATAMANLNSQIAALQAGQPVTQAQLDALNTEATNIGTAFAAMIPATPPATPASSAS